MFEQETLLTCDKTCIECNVKVYPGLYCHGHDLGIHLLLGSLVGIPEDPEQRDRPIEGEVVERGKEIAPRDLLQREFEAYK